ncbi:paired amphipathic helix [Crepidotus variabilis]|uniref:Paired amphipathic helix n=1 Tax=Crepidotus variabilis TaxID=179855 RepID=A0A9P6JLY8_9AGAR|nr:paired amphipathic helix [Crepidotus variabilis]
MLHLNRDEAVSFVDNVRYSFEQDPGKYDRFLDIMKDLKANVIDPGDVIVQIAALFNGHPSLAREFNAFLPPGYRLHPTGEGPSSCIILYTPEGNTVYPRDYARRGSRS